MKEDLKYLWYCSTCHNFNDPRMVICPTCSNYRIDYPPSSDSSLDSEDYSFTVSSPKNSSDEQEAVDGGSENSSHSEAENSKGGKQEPGNVEKSGQETTSPEEKDGGGDIDLGNVPAGVDSDDDGPGPSAGKSFNNYRSGKMEKGGDQVEGESEDEEAKGTKRSTQSERNTRKKTLKKRGPKKQKVKSDDDLAEKFEKKCNSSDEGPKKKCPRK